ncbi:MAG: VWA domain-containing protein, partial [Chloroflexi bacterium]|nr:VWA domain-containing protein [Chloroflexota bacterium]
MKRRALRFFIALVLLLPISVAFMQDESGISLNIIGIDSTDLSQIAIHTSILDSSERLVSGLEVANFSIGGDLAGLANVTRVENVTDDDLAFASVLVIDTSSSMADQPLSEALAAARNYLNALGPNDPVALVTFSDRVRLLVNYTTDREAIFAQFDNLAYGGKTALYDATFRAIELANEAPLDRKAVVILSDGGEYGAVSAHTREESIRAATIHGVPVYSIGLGWDIDQRFLEAIAAESNAEFYNAPRPEELGDIYSNLAFLFRSQYIVTLSADVPADGARYDFTLNVTTADGQSSSGSATLRAPIPVPLVFLPDDIFDEALADDTQITVEIRADQDIESIEVALDGEVVSRDETFTIEPVKEEPGEHQLDITVADVEGDVGRLSREFEIAALPPTVSDDFETAPQEDVGEAEVISVDAGGQTEITQVEFIVDGDVIHTDSEAPYEFDLDPFELLPEEHRLSIRATNASGQTTTVEKIFEVEKLPPRIEVEGLTPETVVSDTLTGSITVESQSPIVSLSIEPDVGALVESDRLEFRLNAAELPPGPHTVAVRAVDEAGAETVQTFEFEVAALAPTVSLSGVAVDAVISGPQDVNVDAGGQTEITGVEVSFDGGPAELVEDEVFTIPAEQLGDGEHEALISVTNEGGQTSTVSLPFTVQLPPTPTFTPAPTDTATATETPTPTDTAAPTATHTDRPVSTDTPSAEEATVTSEAIAALTATARPSATDTEAPTDTPFPTDTSTPRPTVTPVPTDTYTPLPTVTPVPTDTSTPLPTVTPVPTDTNTPPPTVTPVPTDTNTPLPTQTPVPTDTHTPLPT